MTFNDKSLLGGASGQAGPGLNFDGPKMGRA